MHDNLIILAGGASSRMKKQGASKDLQNLTESEINQANKRSKGLIAVGPDGRPILDYLLQNAKDAGYKKIYFIIGEQGDLFKELYGSHQKNNEFNDMLISFAVQTIPEGREKPLGTADALFQVLQQYPELQTQSFTVCNSDNLYSSEALEKLRLEILPNAFIAYNRDSLQFSAERISKFAVAKLDAEAYLLNIIEKPPAATINKYRDANGKLRVSMNAFKFNGDMIYPYLKDCPIHPERNEKELPTVILNMLKDHPKTVIGIPMSEHVPDLTSKKDIFEVKEYLKRYYSTLE